MKYGHFDDASREYVITNPKTPVKWINYVGTLAFGGFVDHTGGALLCKGDPELNRMLKYIPQLPASDFKGHTLYLRTPEGEGYRVFSPYFVPSLAPYELYECHVGLGYSRYVSRVQGIRTEITLFVPIDDQVFIEDVRVTNETGRPITLDACPVVEYTFYEALKQFVNADWTPQTQQSQGYWEDDGHAILTQANFQHKDERVHYYTTSLPISSFESDRRRFLGDNEYGSWASPLGLQRESLSNYSARRGDNIGALLIPLGTLQPGESTRFVVLLGQEQSVDAARPTIAKYRRPEQVDQALEQMRRYWDDYLGQVQVETPDPSLNSMLNVHNPHQCFITKHWSRYLSLYQMGFASRGIGFRDSSQDVLGVLANMPEEGRDLIRKLLHVQKRNGSASHQFNPLTMVAAAGDAREMKDRPQYYGDDHLWVVLSVCAYLKETGNLAFLDEQIPFYEKDADGRPLESGTVLEHLRRSLAFTRGDTGAHGLPLLGFADWNDTVNLRSGAESTFNASLYGKALLEVIDLLEHLGDHEAARAYRADYERMRATVNEHCWDGEWYVRYFDFDGAPLGSHTNEHGKIYVNGQSWPVIAGFAPPERARAALDSVNKWLNTSKGIKLSAPSFNGWDPNKGGITSYPPGAKENGGIFLHANPWVITAETLLGNGDRAYQYYSQINPAARNDAIDEFECEPYVYPQNILGDEHPQFGLARNSWLSGTAAWMYVTGHQRILGVRPAYGGLVVDPCIPRAWNGFRVTRRFRGDTYEITVRNPDGASSGVRSLALDGRPIEGNMVPLVGDGGTHQVEVVLGARS